MGKDIQDSTSIAKLSGGDLVAIGENIIITVFQPTKTDTEVP